MIASHRPSPPFLATVVGSLLLVWGCAPGLPEVTPEQAPRLEKQLQSSPHDGRLELELGIAYYKADRYADAATILQSALDDGAESGAGHLYLGLALEGQKDWAGARKAYSQYLDSGATGPRRDDIQARMAYIVQRELKAQAQQALQQEAQLSDATPTPRSVAVFPFRLVSDDPQLQPLSVALADMMITDLGLSGGVTVLERTQVQALLDEMALTQAGLTEPSTGARAGRLLRAANVVQGAVSSVGRNRLQMATDVRRTVSQQTEGQVQGTESLQNLFDLEKQTVFRILDILGVSLTPAEREAINENRAQNILAFLAYGRGLEAMDQGDYEDAMNQFQQALRMDPGFNMARDQLGQASQIDQGANFGTSQIAQQADAETRGGAGAVQGADEPPMGGTTSNVLQETAGQTNPNRGQSLTNQGTPENGTDHQADGRNPTQEAQGSDQVSNPPTGTISIVIQRPGGGG